MIAFDSVNFHYPRSDKGLDNISFHLDENKLIGLLGKNGAGKTTLLNLMIGTLAPQSGTCRVMGFPSAERHPDMLSDIAFIPESFDLPSLKLKRFIGRWSAFYPKFDHDRLNDHMSEFKLNNVGGLYFSQLSFGQKKKFFISFAFAAGTKLLILDEPTNGLDIPGKIALKKMLSGLKKENRTVILSTHQILEVKELLDQIFIVDQGQKRCLLDMDTVNKLFRSGPASEFPEASQDDVFYSYDDGKRGNQLMANHNGEAGRVDPELFFMAALEQTEKILRHIDQTERTSVTK